VTARKRAARPVTARKRAARRPAPRTVHVVLEGEYAGWECTARADFPMRWLSDLQSGELQRITEVFGHVILDHNMPDTDGEVAAALADVDPYDGLLKMAGGVFAAIERLPPR
jgi:hypothetical protein